MIRHIKSPLVVQAAGNMTKLIEEYVGRVNTGSDALSVAKMKSPEGWVEPGQAPDFEEISIVLHGTLVVSSGDGEHPIKAGETAVVPKGEWVRYSTPYPGGAEYISICVPAFSNDLAHRDLE